MRLHNATLYLKYYVSGSNRVKERTRNDYRPLVLTLDVYQIYFAKHFLLAADVTVHCLTTVSENI